MHRTKNLDPQNTREHTRTDRYDEGGSAVAAATDTPNAITYEFGPKIQTACRFLL